MYLSNAGASEPNAMNQRVTLLELQMIEVLKDRGVSNNSSHPKEVSDPSDPDVLPINRTEAAATVILRISVKTNKLLINRRLTTL